jgi:tricorn protease
MSNHSGSTVWLIGVLVLLGLVVTFAAENDPPLLLQSPTLSASHIVFVYAGDLWSVRREGGDAIRLTTGVGLESAPIFSPDGRQVAFTGQYDGNTDVYVVSAAGGVPRRLTYHPAADTAVGWTPDGRRIVFRSGRNSYANFNRLFTVSLEGGFPEPLPLPMGEQASYSPDGTRLAYVPYWNRAGSPTMFIAWKRYRGGRASPIWIARLADSSVEPVPRKDSNDHTPMWVGNRIYFLSDRAGRTSLFVYDTVRKNVTQLIRDPGSDILSAAAGPGAIVIEQLGRLNLYDLESGQLRKLDIRVRGDFPSVRPRYQNVARSITAAAISPTGLRAAFEARGEILTVPAEKGDIRNLTQTPGTAERYPAWSPDGKWIAYFSDESGEYELHLREQSGLGERRTIALGDPPSFFYSPIWSPDSKKIAYHDKRLNLWYVDLEKGTPVRVDTDLYDKPFRTLDPAWSPDSRWIAYTRQLRNHLRAVFVYSLETGRATQLTDGMSDCRFAQFDLSGKYLYFTASTDYGPTIGWLDMSSFNRPVSRSVYIAVLRKDLPSPLAHQSDEEKVKEEKKEEPKPSATEAAAGQKPEPQEKPEAGRAKKEDTKVEIDFAGIHQRILALPIPARNYVGVQVAKAGILFLAEAPPVPGFGAEGFTVHRFDLEKRKLDRFLEAVSAFHVSANGDKLLYAQRQRWFIAGTAQPPRPGEGALNLEPMEVRVDPRAEWRQMYREVWRIQRDFFYDPNHHGLDIRAAEHRYARYLDGIAHRADLTYLFGDMLGEMAVGHMYIAGGDLPAPPQVRGGLLGADYTIANGRYRFARVYDGENWNPQLRAPLTQPGVNVQAGEYLLAVNGRNLTAADNLYAFFEATADTAVVLRVGPHPDGTGSREVTVVPVASETGLRNLAWIEDNRRKVEQLSNGRLAYVYLPNTASAGYTNFNRYYFSQTDKQGAVIDERFNGGGTAADYIIDSLRRPLLNYWTTRDGADFTTPLGSIYGPKVMIINEFAGSGGDAMPWYFRAAGIGPLVGKRTWGGLVGIYDYPPLLDGGFVTSPRVAFWNPNGTWDVENHGVAPDIEVEFDPALWRQGQDPQLERAVQVVLEALRKTPPPQHKKPAYPNFHK